MHLLMATKPRAQYQNRRQSSDTRRVRSDGGVGLENISRTSSKRFEILAYVRRRRCRRIEFWSVGELHELIESRFSTVGEKDLFTGSPAQQMTKALVHFPNLISA